MTCLLIHINTFPHCNDSKWQHMHLATSSSVNSLHLCPLNYSRGCLSSEFWQISWLFIFRFAPCSVQYAHLDLSLVITFWQITLSTQWNRPIHPPKSHPPAGGGFIGYFFWKFSTDLTLSEPTELRVFNENAIFHMKLCTRSCSHNFRKRNGWKCCPCRSQRPRNVRFSWNVSKFELQMR